MAAIHGTLWNEVQYLDALREILKSGTDVENRTGIDTRTIFGMQQKYYLQDSFPLLTTKKVFWKGVVAELLWLISGDTNIKAMQDQGVHIWDEWADAKGNLGPVYGHQWRNQRGLFLGIHSGQAKFEYIDQLQNAINQIRFTPDSRRIIVDAWNAADLPRMALPPCHMMYQFRVIEDELHCQMYQRSADMFLGVPFNIASYALLTHMVAYITGLRVGTLTHTLGDAHIYHNHFDQVEKQLSRSVRPGPKLSIYEEGELSIMEIDHFKPENIVLSGYEPHARIKGEVAV